MSFMREEYGSLISIWPPWWAGEKILQCIRVNAVEEWFDFVRVFPQRFC
jgi:hypothetical protein